MSLFRLFQSRICALCHDPAESGSLCAVCERHLLGLHGRTDCLCPRCFAYSAGGSVCPDCESEPPPLEAVWAGMRYEAPVPAMLHRWKHLGNGAMARAFWQIMRQTPPPWLAECDAVLAMPVSRVRRLERGFNQCDELAALIAAEYGLERLPHDAVLRQHRPPQSTLNRAERARNIRRVFRLNAHLAGKRIVLVDDVMTTGSTLYALAHTLNRGGAHTRVWVLAKNQN
ncbi:ComF family protein [Conchiformibius kuhniae]|uniref:Phosphoribosyltransferase family protein n=1 Tax=Conchiformibius kuhniae TaxID=211502 RepID=A0A8T9MSR8_9NEIS|nr:ComF family protein [Conchiformibius kuhniae]UOP04124.1 ComF family protein [Conchiformibius kuhniae]